jgi:hypothetical protein
MKTLVAVPFLSLSIMAVGCAVFVPKETRYLQSAQDHATQEEIQQQLGSPALTGSSERGEVVWVYRVRQEDPGSRWTSTGLWCDEYVLTFDQQAVLRKWTHRSEFHGGELMPTYCVTGGYSSKS